jgi:hypothetical protein
VEGDGKRVAKSRTSGGCTCERENAIDDE